MKLDTGYTFIRRCPSTKKQLSESEYAYSKGVCPRCGHEDNSTFTHLIKEIGKWERPNWFERTFKGMKDKWYPKEVTDE